MTQKTDHQATKTLEEAAAAVIDEYYARSEKARFLDGHSDLRRFIAQLEASYLAHIGRPTEVPRKPYHVNRTVSHGDVEFEESHESYGLVSMSRVSGGGQRLFGSSTSHGHYFVLRVLRGRRIASARGERFFEDARASIVEIAMTAAQYIDMMTTPNSGSGTPCTILRVEGISMDEPPPDMGSELKVIHTSFTEEVQDVQKAMKTALADIETILAKKSLTNADKEAIRRIVWKADRLLSDAAPFVLKIFGETAERMASKGKMEVEAFLKLVLERAGIKSIRDAGGNLMLGSSNEDKK